MSKLEQDKDTFIPAPPPIHTQESSSSHSDQATFTHREHENNQQQRHILQQPQHRQRNPMDPNPNPYPYHAEHGPPIDNALKYAEAEEDYQHHKTLWWSRVRHHLRDPFAEFLGTFIMILFGDGSVAQVTLSANPNLPKSSQNKGDYQSISWG